MAFQLLSIQKRNNLAVSKRKIAAVVKMKDESFSIPREMQPLSISGLTPPTADGVTCNIYRHVRHSLDGFIHSHSFRSIYIGAQSLYNTDEMSTAR